MNCENKASVKLTSNIILKSRYNAYNASFMPFDMLYTTTSIDTRTPLTQQQQEQRIKSLYRAKEIRDTDEKFYSRPENKEMCASCTYKDICT